MAGIEEFIAMNKYMRQRARENEFRQGMQSLGPDATPEQMTGLAMRLSNNPQDVMRYGLASEDRKAAIAQRGQQFDALIEGRLNKLSADTEATLRRVQNEEHRTILTNAAKDEENRIRQFAQEVRLQLGLEAKGAANKPPSGYRHTAEGNLEPIPGGPADTKLQGQLNQDTAMLEGSTSGLDRLALEANRLLKHPGLPKTTGAMSVVPGVGGLATIPGTDAANFKAGLETLKSQTGFEVLQNMRNNSKTGGALGQVSDFENRMLQANLASLDRAQSMPEFKAALEKIIKYTDEAKGRLRNAYNMKHSGSSTSGNKRLKFDAQGNLIKQ